MADSGGRPVAERVRHRGSTVTLIYGDVRPILGDFTSDGVEDLVLSGGG